MSNLSKLFNLEKEKKTNIYNIPSKKALPIQQKEGEIIRKPSLWERLGTSWLALLLGSEQVNIEKLEREEKLKKSGYSEEQRKFARLLPTKSQVIQGVIGSTSELTPRYVEPKLPKLKGVKRITEKPSKVIEPFVPKALPQVEKAVTKTSNLERLFKKEKLPSFEKINQQDTELLKRAKNKKWVLETVQKIASLEKEKIGTNHIAEALQYESYNPNIIDLNILLNKNRTGTEIIKRIKDVGIENDILYDKNIDIKIKKFKNLFNKFTNDDKTIIEQSFKTNGINEVSTQMLESINNILEKSKNGVEFYSKYSNWLNKMLGTDKYINEKVKIENKIEQIKKEYETKFKKLINKKSEKEINKIKEELTNEANTFLKELINKKDKLNIKIEKTKYDNLKKLWDNKLITEPKTNIKPQQIEKPSFEKKSITDKEILQQAKIGEGNFETGDVYYQDLGEFGKRAVLVKEKLPNGTVEGYYMPDPKSAKLLGQKDMKFLQPAIFTKPQQELSIAKDVSDAQIKQAINKVFFPEETAGVLDKPKDTLLEEAKNKLKKGDIIEYLGGKYKIYKISKYKGKKIYEIEGEGRKSVIAEEDFDKIKKNKTKLDTVSNYGMMHRPTKGGSGYDITNKGFFPKDVYTEPQKYLDMRSEGAKESFEILKKIRNKPEAEITIYRTSPKNELNTGDWISLSQKSVTEESKLEGNPIYSYKVKAKDIENAGDDLREFGYWGKPIKPKDTLVEEAKKYKSFDEYWKAQDKLYHGTNRVSPETIKKEGFKIPELSREDGLHFSTNKDFANKFGKNQFEVVFEGKIGKKIYKNINEIPDVDLIKDKGLDAVRYIEDGAENLYIIHPSKIKTKSKLEQIYKQAHPEKKVEDKFVKDIGKEIERKMKLKTPIIKERIKIAKKEEKLKAKKEAKRFLDSLKKDLEKGLEKEKNLTKKQVGYQRHLKAIGSNEMSRIKKVVGIDEWKKATQTQLNKALELTKELKEGDKFLTEKQIEGLKDYLKTFDKDPRLVTKRELQNRYKIQEEVLDGFITKRIPNVAFPTVDIKEHNAVIRKVVDEADFQIRIANKTKEKLQEKFEDVFNVAKKNNKGVDINTRVFKKLSGAEIELTKSEQAVADFMKDYFKQAREDLGLERVRKNYVTHLEKTTWEKLKANKFDLIKTIKSFRNKDGDIPLEVMLNLDHIIGSEKFFKFALERKGGIDPTTNIRRIFRQYSDIVETKKALDKILPEGQASVQLLLQNKSAEWLKRYLQNLKGRGLDYKFRSGKSGWVAKGADMIIDFGYARLLGFNYISAIKNIIGGEVNSLTYQTFINYLKGKKRLLLYPKKSYKLILDSGILDGSYIDVVEKTLKGKIKRTTELSMYGGMELAEYEIRGSYFLGELTAEEYKTGQLSKERLREILDGIAITQGIYSKVDSPLFVQTTLGRSIMQFGRWKITNANLVRRLIKGAKKEWTKKDYFGKNTKGLMKMVILYSLFSYLAYEAGKAGNKEAKKIYNSGTELVDVIINLPEEVINAWAGNPLYQTLDSILYSFQELKSYTGIGEEPRKIHFRNGVEDTYFSALKTFGLTKEKKSAKVRFTREKTKKVRFKR